jgi:hypothetical protein
MADYQDPFQFQPVISSRDNRGHVETEDGVARALRMRSLE